MKKLILLLGLLLCLCASSWGSCWTVACGEWRSGTSCGGPWGGSADGLNSCRCDYTTIPYSHNGNPGSGVLRPRHNWVGSDFCTGRCDFVNNSSSDLIVHCTTAAEADSVVISQKCTTGVMAKDTINDNVFDVCKNGEGLLIAFNNPITGVRNSSIGYYIVTGNSADMLDEGTYNHLAALACTEVSLYRGVLNGKYVYWYSTDPEPAGVVNVVRIK